MSHTVENLGKDNELSSTSLMAIVSALKSSLVLHIIASYSSNPTSLEELLAFSNLQKLSNIVQLWEHGDYRHLMKAKALEDTIHANNQHIDDDAEADSKEETSDRIFQEPNEEFDERVDQCLQEPSTEDRNALSPVFFPQRPSLLGCGIDVRRLVYDILVPIGQNVYLTCCAPDTDNPHFLPASYKLGTGTRNLMLACHQLHDEIVNLIYGMNVFALTPREANFNNRTAKRRHPYANSNLWLEQMRPSIKQRVQKLVIFLNCPREEDIATIAGCLVEFPAIGIEVTPLSHLDVRTRVQQRRLLGLLCRAISEERSVGGGRTIWHDSSDIENAWLFQEYLPAGFEKRENSQYQKLESEDAWR